MSYKVTSKVGLIYFGNIQHKEVHELKHERDNCRVGDILAAGHGVGFLPDNLSQASSEGYGKCPDCIRDFEA